MYTLRPSTFSQPSSNTPPTTAIFRTFKKSTALYKVHNMGLRYIKKFFSLLFTVTSTKRFWPPPVQKRFEMVCNVNIVYGNLKSENSQDNAQKTQQNCTFMNLASVFDSINGLLSMKSMMQVLTVINHTIFSLNSRADCSYHVVFTEFY